MVELPFMKVCFKVLLAILSCFLGINVHAQKLPKVQQESVYAPVNIKIDGKATEWDGKFQAYNRANCVYYTVSNDENNLYLTVYVSEWINLDKLIYGGLAFTVSNPVNKTENVSITYPLTDVRRNQLVSRPA